MYLVPLILNLYSERDFRENDIIPAGNAVIANVSNIHFQCLPVDIARFLCYVRHSFVR